MRAVPDPEHRTACSSPPRPDRKGARRRGGSEPEHTVLEDTVDVDGDTRARLFEARSCRSTPRDFARVPDASCHIDSQTIGWMRAPPFT